MSDDPYAPWWWYSRDKRRYYLVATGRYYYCPAVGEPFGFGYRLCMYDKSSGLHGNPQYFDTLKEAKAVGLALHKLEGQ